MYPIFAIYFAVSEGDGKAGKGQTSSTSSYSSRSYQSKWETRNYDSGTGSSTRSSKSTGTSTYRKLNNDPEDYDDPEEYADDAWGDDFDSWDEAYDYWEDY
ncbi:MAG: hypothetical protein K6F86_06355 [Lachnospiraceae bacterium]|nr:hypothetical protein [Lachnospiraceae bacterium]